MSTYNLPTLGRRDPWRHDTRSLPRRTALGLEAGLLGAALAAVPAVIDATVRNLGLFTPFKWVAAGLLGEAALEGVVGIFLGLLLHFALGALIGVLFSFAIPRTWARFPVIAAGALLGMVLSVLNIWLIMPALNPIYYDRLEPATFLIQHVLFGVTVGFAAPAAGGINESVDQRLPGGRHRPPPDTIEEW